MSCCSEKERGEPVAVNQLPSMVPTAEKACSSTTAQHTTAQVSSGRQGGVTDKKLN